MNLGAIVFFSTLGSVIGSLISYCVGFYGGEPLVKKWGKYVFLSHKHLEYTRGFFNKFGGKAVFISRFIPIVRHLISIPAGVARMNVYKFTLDTALGAALWNAFLACLGYYMGENWSLIRKYTEIIDVVVIALIIFAIWYTIKSRRIAGKL